jgi:DNA-directed RNA polymerase specialized sigma24 family protein
MASPTELDIFARSLAGDRRARVELYKKYLRDNPRVCRMGASYADRNDFLHDCFNNLLRTGHSWDKEVNLSRWVESVAVWTALLNERQRDMNARVADGAIRMCAEIEGEDATHGEVLPSYVPPLAGPQDSPSARLLELLTEPERIVFRKRAMEKATWEETAAAAGKPVNTLGPILARVIARLARLVGGPPPMDDDLLPVFSRASMDPQKPEGRAISLQLDGVFYAMTPDTQKIGLATAYDVRVIVLWDTAASATPPSDALRRHLDQCHYCTDLLRALILLQQALVYAPGAEFHFCPGSFTLANAPDMVREAFDQHLAQCPICREERTQALDGQAPRLAEDDAAQEPPASLGKKLAWASAALLILGVGGFSGYRYLAARNADASKYTSVLTSEQQTPTVTLDPRYTDLVENVAIDDARIMASVLPDNRPAVKFALDQFSLGQISQALAISSQLKESKKNDPGVQMLYAMSLYTTRLMTDGYREMLKSEAMSPRESFRCWIMFQFSLMVGDKKILEREAEHLSGDPAYQERVKKVMEIVRKRG